MPRKRAHYSVYVLLCADETFYIGSTNDLKKRLHAHNHTRAGARYTRGRRPVQLAYKEEGHTYSSARAREGELKRLSRREKMMLCGTISQYVQD